MGDTIATMVQGMIQLDKIKKARSEAHSLVPVSGFFFFVSPIPSQKRVARCTNILPTGATLSGVGEGQRLRKGFLEVAACVKRFDGYYPMDSDILSLLADTIKIMSAGSGIKCSYPKGVASLNCQSCLLLLSLSSAAEIRHSARNTRL